MKEKPLKTNKIKNDPEIQERSEEEEIPQDRLP
jgi:hypothetical protein